MGRSISVIDHGIGNIRSVTNALEYLGHSVRLVNANDIFDDSDLLILPGVGNFGAVMAALGNLELHHPTSAYLASNLPFVGICVGMQVLFEDSSEEPHAKGFNFFEGNLKHLSVLGSGQVTPSIGWKKLNYVESDPKNLKLEEAYFVHNYFADGVSESDLVSTYLWGEHIIPAHVAKGNVHGVQFHPEKSRHEGLKFLDSLISELTN
jgi:glutamine amidotransferase